MPWAWELLDNTLITMSPNLGGSWFSRPTHVEQIYLCQHSMHRVDIWCLGSDLITPCKRTPSSAQRRVKSFDKTPIPQYIATEPNTSCYVKSMCGHSSTKLLHTGNMPTRGSEPNKTSTWCSTEEDNTHQHMNVSIEHKSRKLQSGDPQLIK